jgi:hypothetical protein
MPALLLQNGHISSAQRTIDNSPAVYCWVTQSDQDLVRNADG